MARTRLVRRWRRNMEVSDDTRVRRHAHHTVRGVGAAQLQPVHRHRLGFAGVRGRPERRTLGPARDRPDRSAPLVQGAAARAADRDRHVAPGQRRQGRSALRVDPDPRPDGVLVLGAERLAGVPVLPARGGRRVQPHHDVPGDGEPHRRRRARHAAAAQVGAAVHPAGGRAAADPVLVRHPRRRGAHRPHAEERAARGQGAASDHGAGDGHPRRRGGPPHLVRARVPAQAGAHTCRAASGSGCRSTCR